MRHLLWRPCRKGINTIYHLEHLAYSFSQKTTNASNKRDSYLHRTKHAKLGWTFKKTYMYGKFTIIKYNSDQSVQMENILTQLLCGKLICHKNKVFVNYYIHTQGRESCQCMSIFICSLIISPMCIQIPSH